jgi:hypothetical protein
MGTSQVMYEIEQSFAGILRRPVMAFMWLKAIILWEGMPSEV